MAHVPVILAINERHAAYGDVEPVTLATSEVPAGFEVYMGQLRPVEVQA